MIYSWHESDFPKSGQNCNCSSSAGNSPNPTNSHPMSIVKYSINLSGGISCLRWADLGWMEKRWIFLFHPWHPRMYGYDTYPLGYWRILNLEVFWLVLFWLRTAIRSKRGLSEMSFISSTKPRQARIYTHSTSNDLPIASQYMMSSPSSRIMAPLMVPLSRSFTKDVNASSLVS